MTTYLVQIKTKSGYETNTKTTSKREAVRRSQDLASCGFDGRIVTEKGYESQRWTVTAISKI